MREYYRVNGEDHIRYWCDFCGASSDNRKVLVQALKTMACICDECSTKAVRVIDETILKRAQDREEKQKILKRASEKVAVGTSVGEDFDPPPRAA